MSGISTTGFGSGDIIGGTATGTAANINLQYSGVGNLFDVVVALFHTSGNDVLNGSELGFNGGFDYTIGLSDPSTFFASGTLTSITVPSPASSIFTELEDGTTTINLSTSGSTVDGPAFLSSTSMSVDATNDLMADSAGRIISFNNEFSQVVVDPNPVPGPLPLMGAGVAFGFSRKLRRRIKAT